MMRVLFRRRSWRFVVLASAAIVVTGGPAWAWGPHGHRIATRIAEERLTPAAKAGIRELLHQGDTLVGMANWADHDGHDVEPKSGPWHYVNVPITNAHYDAKFCRDGECVVDKIKHFRKVLADHRAPKAERSRALLFFMHFVEDIHQPLHVGDNRDRGGNLTQVQFYNSGDNLHRVWDSTIISDISRDERAWVDKIEPLLTPENVASWTKGGVEVWADESLQTAKKAYFFPAGSEKPLASGTLLGRDYVELAAPLIRVRLAQAGVRLANELNAIFADQHVPASTPARELAPARSR